LLLFDNEYLAADHPIFDVVTMPEVIILGIA